jgi:hypothetical protein
MALAELDSSPLQLQSNLPEMLRFTANGLLLDGGLVVLSHPRVSQRLVHGDRPALGDHAQRDLSSGSSCGASAVPIADPVMRLKQRDGGGAGFSLVELLLVAALEWVCAVWPFSYCWGKRARVVPWRSA